MYVFDRYLLRLFVKVWFVWFASLTGLYFVIEMFTNLDEFIIINKNLGGWLPILREYFAPRVLSFFDRTCGLFALLSAISALAWMRMNNELTALMAAGVSNRRITQALCWAAVLTSLIGAANRELLLPTMRDKLARNAQDWAGSRPRQLQPCYDHDTEVFLNGRNAYPIDRRIELPSFRMPRTIGGFGVQIAAEVAYFQGPTPDHAAGYLFKKVRVPENLSKIPSASLNEQVVVYSPSDTTWLGADECFIVSNVDFEQLTGGAAWRQYASVVDLIEGLRNPSLAYGADVRVEIHRRVVQPFLDLTLFVLGLPIVLSRKSRGVVVALGLGVLLVVGFYLVVMACQGMGQRSVVLSPSLAAWAPLILFVPIAYAASQSVRD